jgi:hypothetical protein
MGNSIANGLNIGCKFGILNNLWFDRKHFSISYFLLKISIAFFMFSMTKYRCDWELTTNETNIPHIDSTSSFLLNLSSFTWLNIKSVIILTFLLVSPNFHKYICLNSFFLISVSPSGIFFSIALITHWTKLSRLLPYRPLSICHNWLNLDERFLCMNPLFAKSIETNSLATWFINVISCDVTDSVTGLDILFLIMVRLCRCKSGFLRYF